MASAVKFSYQRLVRQNEAEDNGDIARTRIKGWSNFRKVHIKKKLKVKIPNLKKLLRRKSRLFVVSLAKVVKRLKDSQSHLGDLFAGNYLFMQVTPSPFKGGAKSLKGIESSRYSVSSHGISQRNPSWV
ncbi:hypothetical protein LguiB_008735 [Lonicera macranthoides]